jgi:hypothetical protein
VVVDGLNIFAIDAEADRTIYQPQVDVNALSGGYKATSHHVIRDVDIANFDTVEIPALVERSPVIAEVGIDRALELSDGVADAMSSLTVKLADAIGVDVVRDGTNVVAILPILGDDADVGYAGILECVCLALAVDNMADLTNGVSMELRNKKGT